LDSSKSYEELYRELREIRAQLEESNDTLDAIRSGEVDALVVKNKDGHQVYSLKSADHTYRIFIEQMTEGAVTLNEDNLILYSNSQFARMLGLPLEKVIGQPFVNFIIPEHQNNFRALILKAWDKNIKGEILLRGLEAVGLPVLISMKTLDLDEGVSMSMILTDLSSQKETEKILLQKNEQLEEAQRIARQLNANLEDTVKARTWELETTISEKTKVEADLRDNQERLTRILETMAEGVVIVDLKGNLTYSNPMAQKILCGSSGEPLKSIYGSEQWKNLKIDGSELPASKHPITVMMDRGTEVYDYEIAVQPKDGDRFYISINAAPIRDQEGTLIGGIGTFMDVTNRRKVSQQKDEFISIASHELKTPLTSLKASMQLLSRIVSTNPVSDKIPGFLDKANKNLLKILYLTDDLMNVSKIQHGQLPLNKTRFNLFKLLDECCNHVKADSSYNFIIEGDREIEVDADYPRIDQVVVNLVNNAIKYAPNSKTIRFTLSREGGFAKTTVQDYGIGISPEKLPYLFNRYYRVDPSGIQFSGLGLGLYISAEIIERHKGSIGVDSVEGQGSTFWFTLPLD
jgi:two-component system phosphate regulon sensor histidine kinase PhoR